MCNFLYSLCSVHRLHRPVVMHFWTFLLIYLFVEYGEASNEAHYECGPHGRFEYCIDGIPGCVIGCHCYPGYYFDTESKICEPNVKLTNDYRRHYFLEPTRSPLNAFEPVASPTPTPTNLVEEKADAISKDADGLGDWLYNQFFKTIENQVINNTDGNAITRRSGGDVIRPIPKRRSRKRSKKKSKKKRFGKKFTKKGLRKKLLRITEDDSLFDSSSGSSSDESSHSSSSDSDTSEESDSHRKIVMINKKPVSPLPSFIFLPNADTPFYPPLGLPPPPIVPMYPMIPVPPVASFYQVTTPKNETTTTSASTTTATPELTTEPPTTKSTTIEAPEDPEVAEPNTDDAGTKSALRTNKREQQNKLMHKLRNKLKRRNKNMHHFVDELQNQETPYSNDVGPSNPMQFRSQPTFDNGPPMDDVDFKYLSQLIHKVDLGKTPNIPAGPLRRNYEAPKNPPEYLNSKPKLNRPASKADDTNDTYYSNLGKQIATLIRKVDTGGDRQFSIDIEHENVSPMQTIFHENRYSPRSYWERFVRSPLKQREIYKNNMGLQSTENLLDLENRVNIATAIERVLSLQELENIATLMRREKSLPANRPKPLQKAQDRTTRLSNRFHVNLLAPLSKQVTSTGISGNNIVDVRKQKKVNPEQNPPVMNYRYSNPKHVMQSSVPITDHTAKVQKNGISARWKSSQEESLNKIGTRTPPLQRRVSGLAHNNFTNPKVQIEQQVFKYQFNPMMLNYRSMNIVGNTKDHKQYHSQHSIMPLFSGHPAKFMHSIGRPSYFHHEYNTFDYFD